MFYTYVLKSVKSGKFYIGSTADLVDRLIRHNSGRSKYTKSERPWELYYKEEFTTRSEAMSRERELKSWKSHVRIEKLPG